MKLKNFEIYSYQFPTTLGFIREGIVVRLITELGEEIGEISPLPGRSYETFQEALTFTKELKKRFLMGNFSPVLFHPSVMFGMEMALSNLLFPIKEDISFKLYSDKLKLKNLNVQEAVALCKNGERPFRVDLNKTWDLSKTIEFCSHFKPTDFLYIEEPVSLFSDLEKFYEWTGISYALDEHLALHPLERLLPLKGLSHLIIKPTLHGGLNQCRAIAEKAKQIIPVFSSAYETGIGLMHIAKIGSVLNPNEPIGIDTHSIYHEHLVSFDPKQSFIKKDHYQNMNVAWNKLKRID